MKWTVPKITLASGLLLTTLSGCNSLYYFPEKELIYHPTDLQLEYTEDIISTSDHQKLHAWTIPAKTKPKNVVVLQFHGNAENRSTHFLSVAWLAFHGVDVVTFDYRGYNGSTGSPSRSGLVIDGLTMIDWLAVRYPKHKRFILGQSLGAAVAIAALATPGEQEKISGLVLESAFHSYRGLARMKFASSWLLWSFQWLPYILLSGDANAIDAAPQLHLPILTFHAKDDAVVTIESGRLLYNKLAKTSSVQSFELEGRQHVAAFADPQGVPRQKMFEFLGLPKQGTDDAR